MWELSAGLVGAFEELASGSEPVGDCVRDGRGCAVTVSIDDMDVIESKGGVYAVTGRRVIEDEERSRLLSKEIYLKYHKRRCPLNCTLHNTMPTT